MKPTLGTCYYPEHWSPEIWEDDAQRMAELGLTWVRIGEFAWSRLEPTPGDLQFEWLDLAIDILGNAGLKVVLGTPTATPPRWMIDKHPDMLAKDVNGQLRKFGSRRHYCFSHQGYRQECKRIVTLLAERYGRNPFVAAWQTDNEYGCHDTTVSYSDVAKLAFQNWLRVRYSGEGNDGDIQALNATWGNVFWSAEYSNFDQIDLPNQTVTQPNPAHELDFKRFSSDQVISFNKLQLDILRQYYDAPVAHNYMGKITDFDHFELGKDLDIASWDSYPIGFLEDRVLADPEHKRRYMRQGDPDFQAFHHDLYRAVGKGRWWVMEQQPGPVNWAPYNPIPEPGMVKLWTWEAFAHGAEAVCYFRWRQAPMAQEQMQAGLLRPDGGAAPAFTEAAEVVRELSEIDDVSLLKAPVALIFDYQAEWMWEVLPQGQAHSYFDLVFENYRALRSLGLSVDILPPTADFDDYKLVLAPGLMHMDDALKVKLEACCATVVLGPRTDCSTPNNSLTVPLGPNWPDLDVLVTRLETIPPDHSINLQEGGAVVGWREELAGSAHIIRQDQTGRAIVVGNGEVYYVGAWLDQATLSRLLKEICENCGIGTICMPDGLRRREAECGTFWINYSKDEAKVNGLTFAPVSFKFVACEKSVSAS